MLYREGQRVKRTSDGMMGLVRNAFSSILDAGAVLEEVRIEWDDGKRDLYSGTRPASVASLPIEGAEIVAA